jgi:uncharacterized protein (DUF1778 family)
MASRSSKKAAATKTTRPLMVRLDEQSKQCLTEAADLRHISVSDYVRTVAVAQARREVDDAREQVVVLTPEEQLSFWNALVEKPVLTPSQRRLGAKMRGEP